MKVALFAVGLVLLAAGCGGGSTTNSPTIGRGQSLQPLPLYRVASAHEAASKVRLFDERALLPGRPSESVRVDRHPVAQLHVTAVEVAPATHFGWHLELYAPEVSRLFPNAIASRPYVALFESVAYRVVPASGDPSGLNLSVQLGTTDKGFAVSMASALTSEVRVLQSRPSS